MTDTIFALAASLGFKDLGHRGPQGVRPLVADSEGRAGSTPPGAVPFTTPQPLGPPRFGDGPPRPGQPGPPPRPQPGPVPHPPPPYAS
jgi:hypothetical protein